MREEQGRKTCKLLFSIIFLSFSLACKKLIWTSEGEAKGPSLFFSPTVYASLNASPCLIPFFLLQTYFLVVLPAHPPAPLPILRNILLRKERETKRQRDRGQRDSETERQKERERGWGKSPALKPAEEQKERQQHTRRKRKE